MNEVKHIAIGKIGKALRFKVISQETGGADTIIFYSMVSRMNPNYIEKRVVSSYFNCGGYSFKDVNDFIEGYEFCKKLEKNEHMYLSHIIYYLILFKKMIFKPIIADSYTDFAIEKSF